MQNINRWIGTGNLTRDPELVEHGELLIANLRIAVNSRVKRDGEWVDKANFFDVTVFGRSAKAINEHLRKGSALALEGRLDYQEWEDKEDGKKRSRVVIIADAVQFTGGREQGDRDAEPQAAPAAGNIDEDIPF